MPELMRLVIDGRKAFDSGIGTYIRSVVPRVLSLLKGVEALMLVTTGSLDAHGYVDRERAALIEMDAPPLGLAEQWQLRRHLGRDSVFWATTLAHPLWSDVPLVATVHDVIQLALGAEGGFGRTTRLASRMYVGSLCSHALALFVNSAFTANELVIHADRRVGARVTITPLGVDPAWFDVRSVAQRVAEAPYFLCVGNVRPHKNLKALILAFEAAAERLPHRLIIVGKQHGFRASDAGLADLLDRAGPRVGFAGFLPDKELRMLVAAADALVFPSLYEGFGLPALEAMAAGVPVIASHAGALPEVCGDAASYFDPRAIENISSQLLAHAALPGDERQRRVLAGIERARAYTWDRTAELTARALAGVLAANGH